LGLHNNGDVKARFSEVVKGNYLKAPVTIAIPSYNSDSFIEETISSILNQSYPIEEILVVDDCSTDDTILIVNSMMAKDEKLDIKLIINDENIGYQRNWNKCLTITDSDYVLILHADDLLNSDAIEKQMHWFQSNPSIALIGGQEDIIDEDGSLKRKSKRTESKIYQVGQIYEFMKDTCSYIPCSSVMFNMEMIKNVGFFDENVLATDEVYWPKILNKYPIAILGSSLVNRRLHRGQTEHADFRSKKSEIIEWHRHFVKIAEFEIRENEKRKLNRLVYKKVGYTYGINIFSSVIIHHRSMGLALFYLQNAISIYPSLILDTKFWKNLIYTFLLFFGIKKNN
jgi:glycosyltransferase involved in cell wall biosynthesis